MKATCKLSTDFEKEKSILEAEYGQSKYLEE